MINDDNQLPIPAFADFDDKPHEECGVFGIYAPGEEVARTTFFGLFALQHRGQESAGIAATDGNHISVRRNLGLVSQAFDEADIGALPGFAAIGHTRYSTAGSTLECNAGPMYVETDLGPIAISHNGNLTNAVQLREELEAAIEAGDEAEFRAKLHALLDKVRQVGKPLPDDSLEPSELILPPADAAMDEVRAMLGDQGLIPG